MNCNEIVWQHRSAAISLVPCVVLLKIASYSCQNNLIITYGAKSIMIVFTIVTVIIVLLPSASKKVVTTLLYLCMVLY